MICCCCCCCVNGNFIGCGEQNCLSNINMKPKIMQAINIIGNILIIIFLIPTLSIIKWKFFPAANLTFFLFIFFIIVACIILGIILYMYTGENNIEKITKNTLDTILKAALILCLVCLFFCILEEILLSVAFSQIKEKYYCEVYTEVHAEAYVGVFIFKKNEKNFVKNATISNLYQNHEKKEKRLLYDSDEENICYIEILTPSVYGMAYFSFTLIEILSIINGIFLWKNKKHYIDKDSENNQNPLPPNAITIQSPQVIIHQNNYINNGTIINQTQNSPHNGLNNEQNHNNTNNNTTNNNNTNTNNNNDKMNVNNGRNNNKNNNEIKNNAKNDLISSERSIK